MNRLIVASLYVLSLYVVTAARAQAPSTSILSTAEKPFDPHTPVYTSLVRVKDTIAIRVNQVAFDSKGPKMAVIQSDGPLPDNTVFQLKTSGGILVRGGILQGPYSLDEWFPGQVYYRADFSGVQAPGVYRLLVRYKGKWTYSTFFTIDYDALAALTIPSILHYYLKQRANTPIEWKTDAHVHPYGSAKTVDMRGGWCDVSGDVSKYLSSLAYANDLSPQQIPLVAWSLANVREAIPQKLREWHALDSINSEALWGADYLMRALAPEGYFRMIVYSYFDKDPKARRVVSLLADNLTDTNYQCAFREGGGMAIAALARISRWKRDGAFTSAQYLEGAERAFAHLLVNNTRYDDDGKENIIDDYCALMAATELWLATDSSLYREEARKRATNLVGRLNPAGYFMEGDSARPFWHASDAGLPIIALARYLDAETDGALRERALDVIKRALDYNLRITGETGNPYDYARQTIRYKGQVKDGFFIPRENETGGWGQGENARLASLAAAALVGGRLVYPKTGGWGVSDTLAAYASSQLSWIMGANPYSVCFLYQFGAYNVPSMHANFGHGSERGGISNGITGKYTDGTGVDFQIREWGNERRWIEQWLPNAAWFLQAVAATAQKP